MSGFYRYSDHRDGSRRRFRQEVANQLSRGRIERIKIAISDSNANAGVIREELQDIIKKHDEGIIGASIK